MPEAIRTRLLTALVLAALLLLALFALPVTVAGLMFGLLLLIGAWEWAALGGLTKAGGRIAYTAGAAVIAFVVWRYAGPTLGLDTLALIDIAVWVVGLAWLLRFPVRVPRRMTLLSGLIVLPLGWWLLTQLLAQRGPWWVLLLFAMVAAADIGAFFSGRAFGRVRLAPAVSPGKTWEGVVGGLLGAAAVGAAAALWQDVPVLRMALLAAAVAAISVIGDLTISMHKRSAGLKDSGRIFPGHGGVLDRIDSLLAALPVFLLGVAAMSGP